MSVVIHGYCAPKFAAVKTAFANNFATGDEMGASVALTHGGEKVVDLWAGYRDEAGTEPWQEDTLVNVWSSTKTMAALVMLMLADRGQLDFYEKVSTYWPEFAQNGKENIEVRHIMSHSAGLPGLDVATTLADFCDHDHIARLLEQQTPWWQPGSMSGYHAITQGQLQGELVRRITGQTLGSYFRQQIAEPLNADFHIGTPESCDARIGQLIPSTGKEVAAEPGSISARTLGSPALDALAPRTNGWRRAEIPAANGHGNARSIATIHSILACGGEVAGQRLLSEAGCRRVFDRQTQGIDAVLGTAVDFGMGFGLNSEQVPLGPNKNTCYWGGWGGSMVLVDCDAQLSFAYVMNQMKTGTTGDNRTPPMLMAMYKALAS
ncbi:MAG: CubicO group peptidase (beta-lactamase class C family) [Paraglaciecola psychrophila]|jgi:CubicO group peptidase (beta-lactamase class C family)